ncbi:MAG: outer membrane lipoprotein carrier protein LolA [Acidobacteria bacterium]|nr:outer membrane lipoprotein carrier protein LolA [Acidobacteriota bacterium]
MKTFSKLLIPAVAIAFFFTAFGAQQTNAQVVNEILKRMETHAKALSSVRSKITMSQHDSVLDDYDVKKGTVNYLPGKGRDVYVRVDWTNPVQEVLIVAGGRYVLYRPVIKQAVTGKTSDGSKNTKTDGALAFMNMSKAQLQANYSIVYQGVEKIGGKEVWHLQLNPKTKTSYKFSEIWVDGDGMPIQSKTVEKNNDSATILLDSIEKNVTIKGSIFKLDLPKDVKIIDG